MAKSIKVVSQIMGSPKRFSSGDDKFGEKIEVLVNDGYEVKAAGCSGAGTGDLPDAHLCMAILQKNVDKLEQ